MANVEVQKGLCRPFPPRDQASSKEHVLCYCTKGFTPPDNGNDVSFQYSLYLFSLRRRLM